MGPGAWGSPANRVVSVTARKGTHLGGDGMETGGVSLMRVEGMG